MTGAAAVETIGLVKRFPRHPGWRSLFRPDEGEKVALAGIDLAIAPGEIFGLLGPNGAGKTTLIKILSTLVLPTAGTVRVAGLDVVAHSLAVRRRIGVIYGDERTFFWRLSATENLRFYATLSGVPGRQIEQRITDLLGLVGLAAAADMRMHHFSSGMKQRLSIARGLLNDPDILFMDEPTHNLDPVAAQELRALVRERVADGRRTVLLTTNIMAEAEELCHRVAFLNHGCVQLTGSIDELRQLLQAEECHLLIVSQVPPLALELLWQISDLHSVETTPTEDGRLQLAVRVRRGSDAIPLVIRRLAEAGGYIWSSNQQELSLEQMFTIAMSGSQRPEPALRGA